MGRGIVNKSLTKAQAGKSIKSVNDSIMQQFGKKSDAEMQKIFKERKGPGPAVPIPNTEKDRKKGGSVKHLSKAQKGGNTSDRSFKLFGRTYDKTLTRTQNDEGSVTQNKVKTDSNDGKLLKKKELSRTTDNGYLTKSNRSKTEYMGDGDSKTKSRSWNLPTNTKDYMDANYKKGGSTKTKKVIKSKN